MAEYLTPVDIANRALDHCGIPPITTFDDDSKAADRCKATYDKLRTAELRRNVWRFAIRKTALRAVDDTTMLLVPEDWVDSNVYPQGSIVFFDAVFYIASLYVPSGVTPGAPNEAYWTVYYGPQTASLYDPLANYYAGEFVYSVSGTTVRVYQCLVSGTAAVPTALPAAWVSTATYNIGDTVVDGSLVIWQSAVDLNKGNAPVAGVNWQAVPGNQASQQVGKGWLEVDATVGYQRINYPIGAGPGWQSTTRNMFRLPRGFLREAPQSPKQGSSSALGYPTNLPSDDWDFEGDYITTSDSQVIVLRFVADIQDVTMMDPMFCEGLGARIGLEICEPLTQSNAGLGNISQVYKTMMGEARAINGIETGPVELPLDDYLACRI